MSYNSTLQSNNADLQAILDSINELPEAGNGGAPNTIVAGDTPVLANMGVYSNNNTSLSATNLSLTIPKAGTYRFSWLLNGGDSAYSITVQGRLYQNGTAVGTLHSSSNQAGTLVTEDIACSAGDVMTVYLKRTSYFGTTYGGVCNLVASIDWDNGF